MQLFDFQMPGMDTPEGQGLLSAAFSLLSARKRQGERGMAGALGQAGQQYLGARSQAQDQMQRRKFQDLQMQSMQGEQADRQRRQTQAAADEAAVRAAIAGGNFDPRAFLQNNPSASLGGLEQGMKFNSALNPRPQFETVAPGSSMFRMGPNGPELAMTAPSAPKEHSLPSAVQEYEYAKGQGYQGTFEQWDTARKRAGASSVNNSVSIAGPENKYNQVVGEGLGKTGLDAVEAAKNAPEVIRNARMVRSALNAGAITGTGAELRLSIQKALETAGLVGPGKAADTAALISGLSKITLAGIKTSGLGAGQGFTNTDREFLEKAVSGTIEQTPQNLRRVADLSERVATNSYQKGQKVLSRWSNDPALKAVAQDTQLDPIPNAENVNKAMQNLPPAQAHRGREIRDLTTGRTLKSNGMTWVEVK